MHASDYFLIWTGGDDHHHHHQSGVVCVDGGIIEAGNGNDDGTTEVVAINYQNKLTWNEIILDDFS